MTAVPHPPQTFPQPRNRLGIVALVLALVAFVAPLVTWIVVGIVGGVESSTVDDAIYVGVIGGFIVFLAVIALVSPLSLVALVLAIVSLFRPGSRAPGIVALVFGVIGSFGLLGLPFLLGEVVPGL